MNPLKETFAEEIEKKGREVIHSLEGKDVKDVKEVKEVKEEKGKN
jgi:hypothetical protein